MTFPPPGSNSTALRMSQQHRRPTNSGKPPTCKREFIAIAWGHSHTCSASIRKAMRRHHRKRDMRTDLSAAYGVRMFSGIASLNYKDGELCMAHLVIRKLIHGGHALTTYLTLIGCRTSGAKSLCPQTRPISQQTLPLNWLISSHGSQAVMTISKRIMWLHSRRPTKRHSDCRGFAIRGGSLSGR